MHPAHEKSVLVIPQKFSSRTGGGENLAAESTYDHPAALLALSVVEKMSFNECYVCLTAPMFSLFSKSLSSSEAAWHYVSMLQFICFYFASKSH